MSYHFMDTYEGDRLPYGSNLLAIYPLSVEEQSPLGAVADWPWAQEKNKLTIQLCAVDFTTLQGKVDKLYFTLTARQIYDTVAEDCQLRVLVDGTPLAELSEQSLVAPYSYITSIQKTYSPERVFRFDIGEWIGETASLSVEVVAKTKVDITEILGFSFEREGNLPDASVTKILTPSLLQEQPDQQQYLEIEVENSGTTVLEPIPVGFRFTQPEGPWHIERIAEPIQPGIRKIYRFKKPLDLAISDPLGANFEYEVEGDTDTENSLKKGKISVYRAMFTPSQKASTSYSRWWEGRTMIPTPRSLCPTTLS